MQAVNARVQWQRKEARSDDILKKHRVHLRALILVEKSGLVCAFTGEKGRFFALPPAPVRLLVCRPFEPGAPP